jgi:hypothetical protein
MRREDAVGRGADGGSEAFLETLVTIAVVIAAGVRELREGPRPTRSVSGHT